MLALLWLLALSPGGVSALASQEMLPPTLAGWQRVEIRRVASSELEELARTEAALWREYGATQAERAVYRQGDHRLRVTAILLRDPAGAYGLFTYFGAGGQSLNLAEAARKARKGFVFYQGNTCVTAEVSPGSNPAAALGALARLWPRSPAGSSPVPSLLAFLPRQGLQTNSERYLLGPLALARLAPLAPGDWVGFPYGAEAVWAEYELQGQRAGLLLASYPTPQLAAARLQQFGEWFNVNGTGNPGRQLVYAKRAGPLVGLLVGIDSGSRAARLLDQLRYQFGVTWSEPTNEPTASDWMLTVRNIFIGTALLVLYLLVCGLLFAGVRLAVQHYLPGKVFNRPENAEIIRLDLGRR